MLQLFVLLSGIIMGMSQSFANFEQMSIISSDNINYFNNALYVEYNNNEEDEVEVEVEIEIEVPIHIEVDDDISEVEEV